MEMCTGGCMCNIAEILLQLVLTLSQQILDTSKLKEFAGYNFRFDDNGRKFSKPFENTVGKEEIAHVFKRLML